MSHNVNMIKFTDGKKEYIWNNNDEIIGMDEKDAQMLKWSDDIARTIDNHISRTGVLEAEGYKILEQEVKHEGIIY